MAKPLVVPSLFFLLGRKGAGGGWGWQPLVADGLWARGGGRGGGGGGGCGGGGGGGEGGGGG